MKIKKSELPKELQNIKKDIEEENLPTPARTSEVQLSPFHWDDPYFMLGGII